MPWELSAPGAAVVVVQFRTAGKWATRIVPVADGVATVPGPLGDRQVTTAVSRTGTAGDALLTTTRSTN